MEISPSPSSAEMYPGLSASYQGHTYQVVPFSLTLTFELNKVRGKLHLQFNLSSCVSFYDTVMLNIQDIAMLIHQFTMLLVCLVPLVVDFNAVSAIFQIFNYLNCVNGVKITTYQILASKWQLLHREGNRERGQFFLPH